MDDRSEEELMDAYVTGDRRAFERLFALLAPRVHGFFLRSFGDRAVADDLLQITFLKMHRARGEFRRGSRVRPWLFAIAARVRLDELRKRYRLGQGAREEPAERGREPTGGAGAPPGGPACPTRRRHAARRSSPRAAAPIAGRRWRRHGARGRWSMRCRRRPRPRRKRCAARPRRSWPNWSRKARAPSRAPRC